MSLASKLLDPLVSYARFWGVDPSAFRAPSKREVGLAAVLAATPILAACPDPNGGGVNPPPAGGAVSISAPASLNSGVLDVAYRVDRDFDRCRLRLHGVTVAVDENVSAGDHVISFPRLRPNETYPVDVLCSDADGFTHDRGQITQGEYRFSMDDFKSRTVNVRVGDLESCSFDPVQEYATSKGNLPVSAFAPLDEGCFWNASVDGDRDSLEFVLPEEIEMIDWLSSEARSEGMTDHTIETLLARTAGLETLLSRSLVWWELDPRIWEDEIAFAQRGWDLYRANVSRGWQDGSFPLDYRILGLKNEHWPEDYQMPGVRADGAEDIIGIPLNPGMIGLSFLNLSPEYLTNGETWLSRIGFGPDCNLAAERKPIFSHDNVLSPEFASADARYPDGIPFTWFLPGEFLLAGLDTEYREDLGNNDFGLTIIVADHSRDLYKGAPGGFIVPIVHHVPADRDGDGQFTFADTDLSEGMMIRGYTRNRDGDQLLFNNPNFIFQTDYNFIGPHLGRLEARNYAFGWSGQITDPNHPGFTYGMAQKDLGMIDGEMIETGSGFVGLGWVDPKFARIAGMNGTNPLVDLSIYGGLSMSPGGPSCEPFELYEIRLD
jgi:hypothetical protein